MPREDKILSGVDEVAEHLRVHPDTLRRYARDFPPGPAGFPTHLSGRWHVKASQIEAWIAWVKEELGRHPEARRMRPVEPPEVADIRGRADPEPEGDRRIPLLRRRAPVPSSSGKDG